MSLLSLPNELLNRIFDFSDTNDLNTLFLYSFSLQLLVCRWVVKNKGESAAMEWAVINNNKDAARLFIGEYGVSPDVTNELGRTPLHFAALLSKPQMIECLLAQGADSSKCSNMLTEKETKSIAILREIRGSSMSLAFGMTAIHFAAMSNCVTSMRYLHGDGASLTTESEIAPATGNKETTSRSVAEATSDGISTWKPIHVAAFMNSYEVLEYLVDILPINEIESKGPWGYTALGCTVKHDYPKAMRLLIQRGAEIDLVFNPSRPTFLRKNAIAIAARFQCVKCLKALLDFKERMVPDSEGTIARCIELVFLSIAFSPTARSQRKVAVLRLLGSFMDPSIIIGADEYESGQFSDER